MYLLDYIDRALVAEYIYIYRNNKYPFTQMQGENADLFFI